LKESENYWETQQGILGAKENPKKRELKEHTASSNTKNSQARCKGKSQETGIERTITRLFSG
jgi:hypothetical protein